MHPTPKCGGGIKSCDTVSHLSGELVDEGGVECGLGRQHVTVFHILHLGRQLAHHLGAEGQWSCTWQFGAEVWGYQGTRVVHNTVISGKFGAESWPNSSQKNTCSWVAHKCHLMLKHPYLRLEAT